MVEKEQEEGGVGMRGTLLLFLFFEIANHPPSTHPSSIAWIVCVVYLWFFDSRVTLSHSRSNGFKVAFFSSFPGVQPGQPQQPLLVQLDGGGRGHAGDGQARVRRGRLPAGPQLPLDLRGGHQRQQEQEQGGQGPRLRPGQSNVLQYVQCRTSVLRC